MLNDQWYIGCATAQLGNKPYPTELGGRRLVLFRDREGVAHALRDRCCHRGLPLSRGEVRNGRLACGFHGWEFEGNGACAKIPSQPEKPVPATCAVESYPCAERDGYVWVWNGSGAPSEAPAIPELSQRHWIQGFRVIACDYERALEITYDSMHIYFAHPTHPACVAARKFGLAPQPFELRSDDRGCLLFSPPAAKETDPVPDRGLFMDFRLPGRIRFEWSLPGMEPSYMYWSAQPVRENVCRMDWLITSPEPTGERVRWTEGGREIIEEDQQILEAIQKTYEEEGCDFERSVEADLPTLTLRRILRAAGRGAGREGTSPAPTRRIVTLQGPAGWG